MLLERVPEEFLANAHHWLILHGRYVCLARRPLCEVCAVARWCDSAPPALLAARAATRPGPSASAAPRSRRTSSSAPQTAVAPSTMRGPWRLMASPLST